LTARSRSLAIEPGVTMWEWKDRENIFNVK
jgi:hypothetical protein